MRSKINMPLLLVAAVAVAGALAAVEPTTSSVPYNISLLDTSPMLVYAPQRYGAATVWNASFSLSPWSSYEENIVGYGESSHNASRAGASVSFQFVGTAAYFYGSLSSGGAVEMTVDGSSVALATDASTGLLGSTTELLFGTHNATLVLQRGEISIKRVDVTVGMHVAAESDVAAAQGSEYTFDFAPLNSTGISVMNDDVHSDDPDLWLPNANIGGGGGTEKQHYTRIGSQDPGAAATVDLGSGIVFMMLNGTTAYDHGQYNVQVTPAPPGDESGNHTYLGFNPWTAPGSVLFMAALDPSVNYSVTITVVGRGHYGNWTDMNSISLWRHESNTSDNGGDGSAGNDDSHSSPRHSINTGAIAGGVVGGVAALSLIALAVWLLRRRKRRNDYRSSRRESYTPEGPFIVDEEDTTATPFTDTRYSPYLTPMSTVNSRQSNAQQPSVSSQTQMSQLQLPRTFTQSQTSIPRSPCDEAAEAPLLPLPAHPPPVLTLPAGAAPPSAQALRPRGLSINNATEADAATALALSEEPKTPTQRRAAPSTPRPRRPRLHAQVTQEADAGIRIETVPPVYDPSWASPATPEGSQTATLHRPPWELLPHHND